MILTEEQKHKGPNNAETFELLLAAFGYCKHPSDFAKQELNGEGTGSQRLEAAERCIKYERWYDKCKTFVDLWKNTGM